ncbi:MAG: aspartate dehydrogenase, partial [Fervidobacterium sp.]
LNELSEYIEKCWYFDVHPTDISNLSKVKCIYIEQFSIPAEADIVVECASVEAVKEYALDVLNSGKDFFVISTGAFADEKFFHEILDKSRASKSRIFLPSGAIGGIDIIYAIRNYISAVKLTTKKPPKAFGIDTLLEPRIVFSGNAREAILQFPQNINVAVTLSFAVGNFEKVLVEIVADPSANENIHEISVHSSVGDYTIVHKNKPSPNPKTSYLAALSLASVIIKRFEKIKIGG